MLKLVEITYEQEGERIPVWESENWIVGKDLANNSLKKNCPEGIDWQKVLNHPVRIRFWDYTVNDYYVVILNLRSEGLLTVDYLPDERIKNLFIWEIESFLKKIS